MHRCIAALEKVGHIRQVHNGEWLFKALLASKPHQEHLSNIADFVWRFCVNYIPLNQVTHPIVYSIPRCDSTVNLSFGDGEWVWLWDAPSGYHQISVSPCSQHKLAFAGPNATKWMYTVMPFGPINAPPTFIAFIHNLDSTWKDLARQRGVVIDKNTNTNIIVDNIFSYPKSLTSALTYMECQLQVAQSQNLLLSLKKSSIFPKRVEFVGIYVCPDGNQPAMSRHQLLIHWPMPVVVCNVAKFVGFLQFYAQFIPNFEVRISPLRKIMRAEYTSPVGPAWTPAASAVFDEMQNAILSDPCLSRYDHCKLLVLRTDFSAKGFGYVACQPANDEVSSATMGHCIRGDGFKFMTKTSAAVLHPVAFGCHQTRGNKIWLHSHLGKGFAEDWAINKNRHMCFGQRFTWVTDCYATKFVLSYDGHNPSILRLQMWLMCWDMDIEHRNDTFLTDADYWSRLSVDLCFDPLLKSYIKQVDSFRQRSPSHTALPPAPKNMPYFRGPHLPPNVAGPDAPAPNVRDEAPVRASNNDVRLPTPVSNAPTVGFQHISNYAVHFGWYAAPRRGITTATSHYTTPTSLLPPAYCQNLTGLCMVLTMVISTPGLWDMGCPSMLCLHATLMQTVAHSLKTYAHAQQFCQVRPPSLIMFVPPEVLPR
jgi:hypothetical protein